MRSSTQWWRQFSFLDQRNSLDCSGKFLLGTNVSFNIFKRQNSTRSSSLSLQVLSSLSLSLSRLYVLTHMFTSAMSLNVDVSSEFRNADATTSSLGAPILGVQSESPVSGTTSSCVCGGE